MFVFREDYYVASREPKSGIDGDDAKVFESHQEWAREMERVFGLAEVIVAKQRHGATGKVKMKFDAKITRFSDLAEDGYYAEADFRRIARYLQRTSSLLSLRSIARPPPRRQGRRESFPASAIRPAR